MAGQGSAGSACSSDAIAAAAVAIAAGAVGAAEPAGAAAEPAPVAGPVAELVAGPAEPVDVDDLARIAAAGSSSMAVAAGASVRGVEAAG